MKKLLLLAIIGLLLISTGYAQEADDGILFGGARYVDQHTKLSVGIATNPKDGNFWIMAYLNMKFSDSAQTAQMQSFEVKGSYLLSAGKFFGGPIIGADTETQENPTKLELVSYFVFSPGLIAGYRAGDWGGLWGYVERNIALEDNLFVNRTDFGGGLYFDF